MRAFVAKSLAVILAAALAACGDSTTETNPTGSTIVPGQTLTVGSSHVISQSGDYLLPAAQFSVRLECQGQISYALNLTGGARITGQCSGSAGSVNVGTLTGPGTALFTITSGSVRVSIE